LGQCGREWNVCWESSPQVQSRNSLIILRLWNNLQDVGVFWELNNDANRQPMALGHEELAEVITAWPLLSADLRQAILAIIHSADVITEPSLATTE
jgi:hypothetical protein